jgi:hypothetical protein
MEKQYTESEVKFLIERSMNMGMSIRQNQLQGYCGKSGKEQLNEWFEIIKNRKNSGLDITK